LASETGERRLLERVEALSPVIPRARWRPAGKGGPVSPFGHGQPGRFSFFVLEVDLPVNNSGDVVPRHVVVGDADRAGWVGSRSGDIKVVAYRYGRGILVAKHRPAPSAGKSLGQVIDEWSGTPEGEPLAFGHPVRHNGVVLHYGVNGAWVT
jgi:hypothetical protein